MSSEETQASEGVRDAWDYWLSQHPASVGDIIGESVQASVKCWLEANADELMDRIARTVAKQAGKAGADHRPHVVWCCTAHAEEAGSR